MPNRPDQSVKTRPSVGRNVVKGYALAAGCMVAGVGALTVMVTGGTLGQLLGASALIILIFLQTLFVIRGVGSSKVSKASPQTYTQPSPVPNRFARDPVLLISVSQLGRVRSILGQERFLPSLRIGSELATLLADDADEIECEDPELRSRLAVLRLPAHDGQLIILTPKTAELGTMRDEVLERTNFFAGLGHDLKSPLNAVIGFADIMDTEIRGPLPEAYRDYPGLIRESGEALLRLVEDMLGYARSEAGTYELDLAPMDIAASGESVMRQSQVMADASGVSLRLNGDQEVLAMADAGAIRRIWDNLVSNAIKYSAEGDVVTISTFEQGNRAVMQVRDSGAGMDSEDLARIAKPFSQGRNAKGRAGTGLGLALVHRLVEMQGGKVKIETSPGAGTTVSVYLPALSETQKRAAE